MVYLKNLIITVSLPLPRIKDKITVNMQKYIVTDIEFEYDADIVIMYVNNIE